MTTTFYKLGDRYYNLDRMLRIDVAYDPTAHDKRHPPGLGVEIVFGDSQRLHVFDAEAEALRAFLAGELSAARHYGIGVRAEVLDFTLPDDAGGGAGPNT